MKILLVTPTQGVWGGLEAFVLAVAGWLQTHTSHEVRVCFKLVRGRKAEASLLARCRDSGLNVLYVRRASVVLARQIAWCDVVHGNNSSPDVVLLAKALGRPIVLTIHNYLRDRIGWRNRIWYRCSRLANWRTYNSQFVRDTWEGARATERGNVIPTVSQLPTEQVDVELRRGFLFAARLIENKGLDVLVRAYAAADLDRAAWPLSIAGDGPLRKWLQQYVSDNPNCGITVLGFIGEAEKAQRIAAACWLVAPANTKEDLGLTPIEARSVAVPAIVSRDGGLPESGGPAALLCEPGDVDSLTQALQCAARMSAAQYAERAALAVRSLNGYLKPLDVYLGIYCAITRPAA